MHRLIFTLLLISVASQQITELPDATQLEELSRLLDSHSKKTNRRHCVGDIILDFDFKRTPEVQSPDDADMQLTKGQVAAAINALRPGKHKKQLAKNVPTWLPYLSAHPNRTIDFMFNTVHPLNHSSAEKQTITDGRKEMERETCLKFREVPTLPIVPWGGIKFSKDNQSTCRSSLGHVGINDVNLNKRCRYSVVVQHEVMHCLGFKQEHQRDDTNEYVILNKSAVPLVELIDFLPLLPTELNDMDTPYDLGSIMHYGATAAAVDRGVRSLTSRDKNFLLTMGQRTKMSFLDIYRINRVYCNDVCSKSNTTCGNGGYADVKNCSTCKCPYGLVGRYCQYADKSDTGCGGDFPATSSKQSVSLVDIKANKTKFHNCNWLFRSSQPGHVVVLKFEKKFELPCYNHEAVCQYSYLEFKLKEELRNSGFRLCCGKSPTETFKSKGQQMLILYRHHEKGERLPDIRVTYWQEPLTNKPKRSATAKSKVLVFLGTK